MMQEEQQEQRPQQQLQQLGVLGKTFHCDMCSSVIQSDIHLFKHGRIYVRGLNQFVCSPCVTAQLKTMPIRHKVVKTGDMRRAQHVCGLCDKTFPNPNQLKAHERVHTCEKPFTCHVCDKSFTQKSNLKTHLKIHTGERQFACSFCDAAFRQKVQLLDHETIHSGLKPYACSQCGQTFRLKKDLRFHARKHAGKGAFVCGTCGKGFHRPGLLRYHEMRHSLRLGLTPTDKKTHKCEFCNKAFVYAHEVKVHQKVHYGGQNRPYKCNQCELTFRNANHLYFHRKMHPVEKPYECNECNLMFKREIQLRQHQKCHTGERPLGCEICGKAYKSELYLKRHKVAKHQVDTSKQTHQESKSQKSRGKSSRRAQRKQSAPRKQQRAASSKEQAIGKQLSEQEPSADAGQSSRPRPTSMESHKEQSPPRVTSQDPTIHSAQDAAMAEKRDGTYSMQQRVPVHEDQDTGNRTDGTQSDLKSEHARSLGEQPGTRVESGDKTCKEET